ncbi:MAG: 3-deoxy-D-manno-octulosonic-acid transferase [Psychromonas sp.]|jgi:3-deoxy-D-manno-octulosonic-acid transferase|uniref:lipid IV(A) 3-deoxy-D-manno-octulosonic acid transferase n=1 Tax=Psychromonas sp. TaxID=1884585 RepID=UPI0039E2BFD9
MIRLTYTLLLTLLSPLFLYSLYKKKEGKPAFGSRWKEHFGITPPLKSDQPPIWIHAVSVGEAIAATIVIKALKKRYPEQTIVVTTTTSTGAEQIAKLDSLVEHRYMPIDFCFAVRGFIKATKPTKMLIMETELWPNTLHTVAQFKIPIYVINARLSEKSYRGYKKVQPFFNLLGKHLTQICCQYKDDAERFITLGISPEKVCVTGSVKFDIKITEEVIESGKQLREQIGTNRPVWIAASTHKGEDEKILMAHKALLQSIPNALLILVPRHPDRFNDVFELCQAENLTVIRRTSKRPVDEGIQVYIGDTMGEMLTLIGASDACFMGGSLLGNKVGGHNILEPIALNIPTIIGPSYFNFAEIVNTLVTNKGCLVVQEKDLTSSILTLLTDIESATELSSNALRFFKGQQGAIDRSMGVLFSINKVNKC